MSIWNEKRRKWLVAVLVVGASDTADRSVRTHPSFTLDAATHHLTLPNKVSRNRKRMSDKNRNETSEAVTPPATTNIMQITSSNYQSRRWNLTGTANWTRRFKNRAFEYSFVCTCTPWAIKKTVTKRKCWNRQCELEWNLSSYMLRLVVSQKTRMELTDRQMEMVIMGRERELLCEWVVKRR